MSQVEVVSNVLQQAVDDQIDQDFSIRKPLQPFIEKVGGLSMLITMFLELARAVRDSDDDLIDTQYQLVRANDDLSPMFEHRLWNNGMLSAAFIGIIIRAEQEINSKKPVAEKTTPEII